MTDNKSTKYVTIRLGYEIPRYFVHITVRTFDGLSKTGIKQYKYEYVSQHAAESMMAALAARHYDDNLTIEGMYAVPETK